jgi:hypothetical protein
MKTQIKDLLFIDEKFISKRSRKEYFEKHNQPDLYNQIKAVYGNPIL